MCGIVGMMRFDGRAVDERALNAMRDAMLHRGPDDAGTLVDGPIGIGQRRLSIVDLSPAGHNPMCNEDGTIWIVFNGECYNYVELREELLQRGHKFSSHTDTECIIHLYEEMGERCVEKLGGMFAFVIWDSRRKLLFAARDRIGIKPFHYYADAHQFVCASEIKGILAAPGVTAAVDHRGIADYFFSGFPLAGRTLFSGINQLPPGHSITVDANGVRTRKYWDVEYKYNHSRSSSATHDELTALLDDAVKLHCRSDATLGCHLSGGIDSSTVTGLAAHHRGAMKTFSIRFAEGGWYDETQFARAQAAHSRAQYMEAIPDGNDLGSVLPGLVWHMEMPLPNLGGFSYFTVSRLASAHVKVTLTGHGGDEVFAGYPAQFRTAFGTNPFPTDEREPDAQHEAGAANAFGRLMRRIQRLGVGGIARGLWNRAFPTPMTPEDLWVALHCGRTPDKNPLLAKKFVGGLAGYSPRNDYLSAFTGAPTNEMLDRCLYHDLRCYLPGLLHMEDRVSMAVSVESRVPLLDHRIVEFMATVPPMQKVPGMQPKALLRNAAGAALADAVRYRKDKRPFPVPFQFWVREVLKNMSREVLLAPQSLDRGIFDADRLRRWDLSAIEIWGALNLELWFRIFIDREQPLVDQAMSLRTPTMRPR
ncbi:MAG TPA: asparagine synthase (glutamine-hydrolyzing) [Gemmatimonadaceae bacterium]|nr:asparagine synthase (glutamine-hydrolyzing) [Gemmatimonadaceae bacterium]